MQMRISYARSAPGVFDAMESLDNYLEVSSVERPLRFLVQLRASQINGCAYCLDMHTKDARAAGESEQRLYTLSAWRETPFFSARERAALAWTEAVTRIADAHVSDAVYTEAASHFDEKELVDLTLAVIAINGWNRLAITFQASVGGYQPAKP